MQTTCGLDIASTSACACVQKADGTIVKELNVPATREGEDRLLAVLPAGAAIFMESTGRYHLRWARRLSAAGYEVYVLNALLAKRLMGAVNALRQNKTDKIDARELAALGRKHGEDLGNYRYQENAPKMGLRVLCQIRVNQRKMLTDSLKSASGLLATMLPEVELSLAQNRRLAALFLKIDSLAKLRGLRPSTLAEYACSKADELQVALKKPLSAVALFDALLPALQGKRPAECLGWVA